MKKVIIITSIASILFAGNSSSTFKRAESKEVGHERTINFKGRILSIYDYKEYIQMNIDTEKNGYINIKVNSIKNKKENDRISGKCTKYNYGLWKECFIR